MDGCVSAPALFLYNVISSDSCVVSSPMFLILCFLLLWRFCLLYNTFLKTVIEFKWLCNTLSQEISSSLGNVCVCQCACVSVLYYRIPDYTVDSSQYKYVVLKYRHLVRIKSEDVWWFMVFCVYEVLNGWIGSRFIFFLPHIFGDSFCGSEAKTRQKLGSTTTELCASIIIRGLEDGGNIRAPDPYGRRGGSGWPG